MAELPVAADVEATAQPVAAASSSTFVGGMTRNPFFSAGVGITGIGVGLALLRRVGMMGVEVFKRQFTISLEVPSKDRAYPWLLRYLAAQSVENRHMSLETSLQAESIGTAEFSPSGSVRPRFSFLPSTGTHFINFRGKLILVRREREKMSVDTITGKQIETLTLTTIGRSLSLFSAILREAQLQEQRQTEGRLLLYTTTSSVAAGLFEWQQFGDGKMRRPMHSVVLDDGIGAS